MSASALGDILIASLLQQICHNITKKSPRNVVIASVSMMSIFTPDRLRIRMACDDSLPHN